MKGYGTILLRVTVGAIYLMQAYLALFVAAPRGTATFIAKMGLPAPTLLALIVILIHGVGGALLVLGAWTRLAAAANAVALLVGLLATYVRRGVVLKGALLDAALERAHPAGYEYVALLLAATLALALTGAGAAAPSRSK
jgi:putative oxidoreductase